MNRLDRNLPRILMVSFTVFLFCIIFPGIFIKKEAAFEALHKTEFKDPVITSSHRFFPHWKGGCNEGGGWLAAAFKMEVRFPDGKKTHIIMCCYTSGGCDLTLPPL